MICFNIIGSITEQCRPRISAALERRELRESQRPLQGFRSVPVVIFQGFSVSSRGQVVATGVFERILALGNLLAYDASTEFLHASGQSDEQTPTGAAAGSRGCERAAFARKPSPRIMLRSARVPFP